MRQATHILTVEAPATGLVEVTQPVLRWVAEQGIGSGLLTLMVRHTSASLLIQENADPDVLRDLETFFDRLVPEGADLYRHLSEGPDDMPSHIRGALTQTSLSIPVVDGRPALGTWQGIFLFEHRRPPRRREIAIHLIGD